MRRLRFGFSASVETTADGENARIHEIKQKRGQPPKADPFSLLARPPGLGPPVFMDLRGYLPNPLHFFIFTNISRFDNLYHLSGFRSKKQGTVLKKILTDL
jgi:hypothetical protein